MCPSGRIRAARTPAQAPGARSSVPVWTVSPRGTRSPNARPASPDERVRELARRYRRALLAHRDGAALVTGAYAAEPHTLRFADALVGALLAGGRDEREAAWTAGTVVYFALGLAQEEQAAEHRAPDAGLANAVSETAHPALHRVLGRLVPGTFDERFAYGLTAILARR